MKITIRKTKLTDAKQQTKLTNAVWRTAYAHIMPEKVFNERDAEFDKRIELFGSWGLNKNGNIDYVAAEKDKIVAIIHGSTLSNYSHYRELCYADLTAIYVYPEYQRIGIGKKLFDLTISTLKKQGCKKMVIGVLKENLQARKAYEKWGCVLDVTYEKAYEKFGFSFQEVFYIYDLIN